MPGRSARYVAYLASPAWRERRRRALERARERCQQCGSRRRLQVHHLSYERLGAESDADLVVLCERCHEGAHGLLESVPRVQLARTPRQQRQAKKKAPQARVIASYGAREFKPWDTISLTDAGARAQRGSKRRGRKRRAR